MSIHLQDAQDIAFFEEQLSKAPDFKGDKAKLVAQTQAIKDIVFNKEANDYFDTTEPESKFSSNHVLLLRSSQCPIKRR